MVLADISSPRMQTDVPTQDSQIEVALSAWLAALSLASPNETFSEATNQGISLCKCFTLFAPTVLSERDYFTPASTSGVNISRQRRYNTRRLARSLANWFRIAPRSSAETLDTISPPVQLAPAAKETICALTDAARNEDSAPMSVMLTLAEVLLCAAVHSKKREMFIKAVLTLNSQQQDALARSIGRTTVEEKHPSVLSPVIANDENVITGIITSPQSQRAGSAEKLVEPSGIPLADYKALAAERDNLRKKLAAVEAEKKQAFQAADGMKLTLEEASDQLRQLKSSEEDRQAELAARSAALNEAKNALRDAQIDAEEMDVLRAKAASAEQLETSLKRASKRLEEVAEMRKKTKDMEAQISAFRENEERMAKHADYLESQVNNSSERANQLATLSDSLSVEIEKKDEQFADLEKDHKDLKSKLDATNEELTTLLMHQTTSQSNAETSSTSAARKRSDNGNVSTETESEIPEVPESVHTEDEKSLIENSRTASDLVNSEVVKEMVSETLYEEIGVRMGWTDIVECVRGVMDALKEMDELDAANKRKSFQAQAQNLSQTNSDNLESTLGSHSSSHSLRSEVESHNPDVGSDSESRMSLLPEFGALDSSLAAASGGNGDEFDFAANQVNVEEITLDAPALPRRASQLATIPENREGFDAARANEHDGDQESSYDSGYLSEREGHHDEGSGNSGVTYHSTQNVTGHEGAECNLVERKSSESECNKQLAELAQPLKPNTRISVSPTLATPSQRGNTEVHRGHSLSAEMNRSASLALSARSGLSRTPSSSETTRSLVRQARNELASLQNAVELMRTERNSSGSVTALVHQLDSARQELSVSQGKLRDTEERLDTTRRELGDIAKEMDSMIGQQKLDKERETQLLSEKERLLGLLSESVKQKEEEIDSYKNEMQRGLQQIETLKNSETALEGKLRAAEVIERAHLVEIARLTAQIDANDKLTSRLNAFVKRSDGFYNQMSRERETHLNDMAAAVRKEKQLAEKARDEARRVAESHASVLDDVRATATAAALRRLTREEPRVQRKSNRFSDFWRRLLHLERPHIDYTMPPSSASLPAIHEQALRMPSTSKTFRMPSTSKTE